MKEWEEIHGPNTGWQLIEVVDGFHPSQVNSRETIDGPAYNEPFGKVKITWATLILASGIACTMKDVPTEIQNIFFWVFN